MEKEQYLRRLIGKQFLFTSIGTATTVAINANTEKDRQVIFSITSVLYFDDYCLHVNNPIRIVPAGKELGDLVGGTVSSVEEREKEAEIVFDNGYRLLVDMRDEVYFDPEAMCLYGPDNFWAVWH